MLIVNINIAISKTHMIIFKIDIAYVSNLAHACLQVYSANSNILGLGKVG